MFVAIYQGIVCIFCFENKKNIVDKTANVTKPYPCWYKDS
jgi:hypothetical protein